MSKIILSTLYLAGTHVLLLFSEFSYESYSSHYLLKNTAQFRSYFLRYFYLDSELIKYLVMIINRFN